MPPLASTFAITFGGGTSTPSGGADGLKTRDRATRLDLWAEIEGFPYAFGLTARDASWFAARAENARRLGTYAVLTEIPTGVEAEARPLEGASSVGSYTLRLVEDADGRLLELVASTQRRDGWLRLNARAATVTPLPRWQASHDYVDGDLIQGYYASGVWGTGDQGGIEYAPAGWYAIRAQGNFTSGSVEPTWAHYPGDADGAGAWLWQGVDAPVETTDPGNPDLDASDADAPTIGFKGTATEAAYPVAGGIFYCGRETFVYTTRVGDVDGYFTDVTRNQYAIEGTRSLFGHTGGDIISPYPRFVGTRRCYVYASEDGTEAGKLVRHAGIIAGTPALSSLCGFELQLNTVEAEQGIQLFADQRRARLSLGIANAAGVYSEDKSGTGQASYSTTALECEPSSLSGGDWVEGEQVLVRVDDEYVGGTLHLDGDARSVVVTARGLFGSKIDEHRPDAEVLEVFFTGKQDTTGPVEHSFSHFVSEHPIDLVLQVWTSREGDGANGPWDVLPRRLGLGIDQSRIDLAGVVRMRDAWVPGVIHRERVEAAFRAKDKIAEWLKPILCYPVQLSDGRLTLRHVGSPIPSLSLHEVTASDVAKLGAWEQDYAEVYGRVIFRADFDPTYQATGSSETDTGQSGNTSYRQTFTGELQGPGVEAQEFYPGQFKTLTVECPGAYTGLSGSDTGAADQADRLFETVRDRYSRPPPIFGLELLHDQQDVEVGDLIRVTVPALPDVSRAMRGLDGAICEVLRRTVNDAGAVVAVTVAQRGYGDRQRLLAPSAQVSGYAGGSVSVDAHAFGAAGDAEDAQRFRVGDSVVILSADLATTRGGPYPVTGITVGGLALDVSGGAPAGVVAGDVVLLADYQYQPDARKGRSAFLADAAGLPTGSGDDAAHEYAT